MLEFQEKRKVKKLMYSWITIAILAFILVLLLNGVWGVYLKQDLTKENLSKTTEDLENLKEREQKLVNEINSLKTEAGKESEIREKYGLVKPGEEVIVIVDKNTASTDEIVEETTTFWQKIMNMLK